MSREALAALAAELLGQGRAVRITARGGSMAPFIRDGDEVLLEPLAAPPRRGEVVLSRSFRGALTLHRVVRGSPGAVVTRGDATAFDDPPVPPQSVLGRAVQVAGRRRWHLRPAPGRLVLRGLALRRRWLGAPPLRSLARAARALAARIP